MNLQHVRKRPRHSRQKRLDFVRILSKELTFRVFSYLSFEELLRCATVNFEWKRLANDEMLWKPLFHHHFESSTIGHSTEFHWTSKKEKVSASRYGGSWKTKFRVHKNWLSVRINSISSIDFGSIPITFIKLVQEDNCRSQLVAGYENGGFSLWVIDFLEDNTLNVHEVTSHDASSDERDAVIAVDINRQLVLFCTQKGRMTAVYIERNHYTRIIQQVTDSRYQGPITLELYPLSGCTWLAFAFASIYLESNSCSVRLQKLYITTSHVETSYETTALDTEAFNFLPEGGHYTDYTNESTFPVITSMVYSTPNLVVAYANNTMKHYVVSVNHGRPSIRFEAMLYGHTSCVRGLALEKGRLLSVDLAGINVWNMFQNKGMPAAVIRATQAISQTLSQTLSCIEELPLYFIRSICFDETRIVLLVNNAYGSFVRIYSFYPFQ
ncbi:hypothetical protein BY458DRAFT_431526 [Sporodiniella umbellata]|nr:hypothetical protein BY458DRAFT_431526 [Sporodiniella umbellata]